MADAGVVQGTLDLIVLKALSWGPMHGYAVSRWVRQTTDGAVVVEEGALYPALHRLEKRGLIEAEWGLSENNRKAKYYRLTDDGRRELRAESAAWERNIAILVRVLTAPQPGTA
jgi:PadR family transcriptional regulator, regulatory protein PadR